MRTLIAPALLLACGVAYTQQPSRVPVPQDMPPSLIPPASVPTAPLRADSSTADKTIDQLLDRLEAIRAQRAELEKAEQELTKEIRRKLEKQSDRISRLGLDALVGPAAGAVLAPSASSSSPVAPSPTVPPPTVPRN